MSKLKVSCSPSGMLESNDPLIDPRTIQLQLEDIILSPVVDSSG